MRNEQLHAAVLAAPDDDAPRLVYADWLLERGDPRGEMIALQLEHARLPAGDARAKALAARAGSLWQQHQEAWQVPYGKLEVIYRRGFVETLRGTGEEFAKFGSTAVLDACVRELALDVRDRADIDIMSEIRRLLPQIRLRDLSLWRAVVPDAALRALVADPGAHELESFFGYELPLGDGHIATLAHAGLTRLHALSLEACRLTSADTREFSNWPTAIHKLRLRNNQLGPMAIAAVLDAPALRQLSELDLRSTAIAESDVAALADAALPLVSLQLSDNMLGPAAISLLAGSPCFARLERLGLANTAMGRAGLDALLASPYLPRTLELALDGEILGLEPDIWHEWTGNAIGASWRGEPPEHVKQRFRVIVEGSPTW